METASRLHPGVGAGQSLVREYKGATRQIWVSWSSVPRPTWSSWWVHNCFNAAPQTIDNCLLQTVVLALSCLMATLLLTPSEAAPAPAPAPAPQALESLLLAKLLFLKGDVDNIYVNIYKNLFASVMSMMSKHLLQATWLASISTPTTRGPGLQCGTSTPCYIHPGAAELHNSRTIYWHFYMKIWNITMTQFYHDCPENFTCLQGCNVF